MNKNKEPQVETVHLNAKETSEDLDLGETALAVTKNPTSGNWEVLEFKYNSVNGKVKLDKRHAQTDRLEAMAQFRVMAATKVLNQ